LGCAVVAVAQDPVLVHLNSKGGPLILHGRHYSDKTDEEGVHTFDGTGNPVIFERPEQGVTLSANHSILHFAPTEDADYVLKEGQFIGNAHYHSDTSVADKALLEDKKPLPKRPEQSILDLVSEVKTVELTGPETFDQNFTLDGSSGIVVLDPSPKTPDKKRLRKGSIEGPVHFHLIRNSQGPGDIQVVTDTTDGTADHLDFDFTGTTPTVTAEGHVVIKGNNGGFDGTFYSDKTVITLDDTLKVKTIDSSGGPTNSTLKKIGGLR
jgi:hypothetical protein